MKSCFQLLYSVYTANISDLVWKWSLLGLIFSGISINYNIIEKLMNVAYS